MQNSSIVKNKQQKIFQIFDTIFITYNNLLLRAGIPYYFFQLESEKNRMHLRRELSPSASVIRHQRTSSSHVTFLAREFFTCIEKKIINRSTHCLT